MEISREIIQIIEAEKRALAPVTPESNLYTDLGFDSLSFVCLLMRVEQAFGISFDIMEMGMCLCVGRLISLAERKVKERS